MRLVLLLSLVLGPAGSTHAQQYDLLLKGGHVIDGRNNLSSVRDVAIRDGKIAAVAADIPASRAFKTVDIGGLYVTPGLIDIHVHVYRPTVGQGFRADNNAVYPDGFSFRSGVTTVVDPGGSGWRNFEDMKDRVIDRSRTRVLALVNIVGRGSAGREKYEQDLSDMEVKPTAEMALKHKGLIVGVKSAHYAGPEWDPFSRAVEVGEIADIPVVVDFGSAKVRTIAELFTKYLRPQDIYTHVYGGTRSEQDVETGGPSKALVDGRKRGILFDVGHGGGSLRWRVAVPLIKAGFLPDTISSDLHVVSMNAGLKDLLNLMSKFLAMGMQLDQVVMANTWNAAKAIKREQLGNLSIGSVADVAVLRLEKGDFGFIDAAGARLKGKHRLRCELTLRDGKVVYDLNGMTRENWDTLPADYGAQGDSRWDAYARPSRSGEPRRQAR